MSEEAEKKEEYWDMTKHRDELYVSDFAVVYHKEQGVLCQGERHYGVYLNHPIVFKSIQHAWQWVREGCIGELQEGLGTLHIGFRRDLIHNYW